MNSSGLAPCLLALIFLVVLAAARATEPLAVRLSTNLEPRMHRAAIFAVDGNEASYFGSRQAPKADDHFTVTLESPSLVGAISALTGKADGTERLADGALEVSEDGNTFAELTRLKDGAASAPTPKRPLKAVRVRARSAGPERFALRELRLGDAALMPAGLVKVERKLGAEFGEATLHFVGDASLHLDEEQKKLTAFLEKAGAIYLEKLGVMAKRLETPWEEVPKSLLVIFQADTGRGVPAYASGSTITLNTRWVLRDPADSVGMFIHELSHVAQRYPPGNPGWLVEGLSDLIRLELSPADDAWVKRTERIDPKRSDYKRGYGDAAKFLAWVQKTQVPALVGKLSRAMHEGKYREELWTELASQDLAALWAAYQAQ